MSWQMKSIIEELKEKKERFIRRWDLKNPELELVENKIHMVDGGQRYSFAFMNGYEINGKKLTNREIKEIMKNL